MTMPRHVVFLLNLLQDVNIVRPLAYLAARDLDVKILFLVSGAFLERDMLRIWQREIGQICADTRAVVQIFETTADAFGMLQGKQGILIAASESTLSAHATTHNVMRVAPSSFLRVTLQHGYECVGFLQNREHVIAHGRNIKFAADVICGWCEAPALTAMAASERPKLYVSGSPMLLNRVREPDPPAGGGLVCENLHSVRMRMTGDFGKSFMDVFERFCAHLGTFSEQVTLRPHPGGMYVVKNNIVLPPNVTLNTRPMYNVDLSAFTFGISAPSTVVLDMVFAGIPTAVWRDEDGIMDASNYEGLTPISSLADWFAFARDAVLRRDFILERQREFVSRLRMPVDRKDVHGRFARLLAGGTPSLGEVRTSATPPFRPKRLAFVTNGTVPTLQLSFLKPLQPFFASGEMEHRQFTEIEANEASIAAYPTTSDFKVQRLRAMRDWFKSALKDYDPDLIVCCRYSGPATAAIADYARANKIPLVFHVDDDLLNIPPEIGEAKYLAHNQPSRLTAVDTLLKRADLVYTSTSRLRQRFRNLGYRGPMFAGQIYCSGDIINRAELRPVRRVGYMGFDHENDFRSVLPELVRFLRRNTEITFELFGSIPKPEEMEEFGDRIVMLEPRRDYEDFLNAFASREWDIGICPLVKTPFNTVKANTKWVEYTCVGAAVVATSGLVYDECCADGCGELAGAGEWLAALERFVDDPALRYQTVLRAQAKVEAQYSVARLRDQIFDVFEAARAEAKRSRDDVWPHFPKGTMQARVQFNPVEGV